MIRYVQDGAVYVEWFHPKRKQKQVADRNTKEAREQADETIRQALALLQRGEQPPTSLSIAELLARYLTDAETRPAPRTGKRLRPPTLRLYREQVQLLGRYLDVTIQAASLRKGPVNEARGAMRRAGVAEGRIARAVRLLKSAYRWAVGEVEILPANPISELRVSEPPKSGLMYQLEEIRAILSELDAQRHPREWRFRVAATLVAYYIPRVSQVLELRWSDVDFDAGTVRWRQDARGSKGQKDAKVALLPRTRTALLEAWAHRQPESPWVLWHWRRPAEHAVLQAMYQSLRRVERRATVVHIPGRGFHAFRRSLATLLAERLGVKHAAEWMRDTLEVTASTYVQPTAETQAAAAQEVERLFADGTATERRARAI
jgi:integrase